MSLQVLELIATCAGKLQKVAIAKQSGAPGSIL